MAERSLSMREAPGSIPGLSTHTALRVGGLYSSVGQSARLVSARSGVRTSLEALFSNVREKLFWPFKKNIAFTLARTIHRRAGLVVDRTRDL